MKLPAHFEVVKDPAAAAARAADLFVRLTQEAVAARGRAFVALAGGTTPRDAYALLAAEPRARQVPWPSLEFFFGDERCVPPADVDSNFRMANETLLSRVPVSLTQVHRIRGESDPAEAARDYANELRKAFPNTAGVPRFDLVLLGMGADGHTASLFPGSPALDEAAAWAVPCARPDGRMGVTLTFPIFDAARHVILTATGAGKAAALRRVLTDGRDPLPAARVRPRDGSLTWIVDEALASAVKVESRS